MSASKYLQHKILLLFSHPNIYYNIPEDIKRLIWQFIYDAENDDQGVIMIDENRTASYDPSYFIDDDYMRKKNTVMKVWRTAKNIRHRDFDRPAVISYYISGTMYASWCKKNPDRNLDGIKTEEWFFNGKRHRDNDLPAIIKYDVYPTHQPKKEIWWKNGRIFRDNDQPSEVIYFNGKVLEEVWYEWDDESNTEVIHRDHDLPAIIHYDMLGSGKVVRETWMIHGNYARLNPSDPVMITYQIDHTNDVNPSDRIRTFTADQLESDDGFMD